MIVSCNLRPIGMRKLLAAMLGVFEMTALPLLIGVNTGLAQSGPESSDAIAVLPLETRRGHIYIRPKVKGAEAPVTMMLDTGFTITTLRPDLAEALPLRRSGHTTIMGISGKEEAPVYDGAVFTLGNFNYAPRRVAALPSDRGSRR